MSPLESIANPGAQLLTLALLHFVWQGLAIVAALCLVIELLRVTRPQQRYALCLVALLAMAACPIATLGWLAQANLPRGGRALDSLAAAEAAGGASGVSQINQLAILAQPYVLTVWAFGVLLLGSRLLTGAVGTARLRSGRLLLPHKIVSLVEPLGKRLRLDATRLVFLSRQVSDAMAIGLIRPMVLIPASWATEMPLDMLEAVIAHELAHLCRRDLWVNLLQRVVETLLFYHPAVWWLSRRLRIERELCADELAVAITGKRLEYAQTLEHLAAEQRADIRPALATFLRGETNMRVLERVRNVLGQPTGHSSRLWPAGMIAVAMPFGLWAVLAFCDASFADDDKDRKPAIKVKDPAIRLKMDLLENKLEKELLDDEKKFTQLIEDKIRKPAAGTKEYKLLDSDGKLIEHKILGIEPKPSRKIAYVVSDEDGPRGDRRLDELTALVKRLSAQVERLQDEVADLRGGSASDRRARVREEETREERLKPERRPRNDQENVELELRKRKEATQRLSQELEAKAKELADREQDRAKQLAAREQERAKERAAEAAERAKERAAEAKERAIEQKERAKERTERERERAEERARKEKERDSEQERIKRKPSGDSAWFEKFSDFGKLADWKKLEDFKFLDKDFTALADWKKLEDFNFKFDEKAIDEIAENAAKKAAIFKDIGVKAAEEARKQAEATKDETLEAIKRAIERKKDAASDDREGPKKKSIKSDREDDGEDNSQDD